MLGSFINAIFEPIKVVPTGILYPPNSIGFNVVLENIINHYLTFYINMLDYC